MPRAPQRRPTKCARVRRQTPGRSAVASPLSPVASPPLSPHSVEAAARRRALSPAPSGEAPGRAPPDDATANGSAGPGACDGACDGAAGRPHGLVVAQGLHPGPVSAHACNGDALAAPLPLALTRSCRNLVRERATRAARPARPPSWIEGARGRRLRRQVLRDPRQPTAAAAARRAGGGPAARRRAPARRRRPRAGSGATGRRCGQLWTKTTAMQA